MSRLAFFATVVSIFAASWPAALRAEDAHLVVVWEAPPGCATPSEIEADATALAARARVGVRARGRVEQRGDGAYHLDLGIETGAGSYQRALTGATCAEVGSAAATLIALALVEEDAAKIPPRPVHVVSPSPPAATPPASERPVPSTQNAPAAFSVDAVALASTGQIGAVVPGFGVRAGWERGMLRIELRGNASPYASVSRTDLGIGGRFSQLAIGPSGCVSVLQGRTRLGPCLGLEIGRIEAEGGGSNVMTTASRGKTWFAASVGALLVRPLVGAVELRAELDLTVPFVRDSFAIDGVGEVYRAAVLSGRAAIGVGVHFP